MVVVRKVGDGRKGDYRRSAMYCVCTRPQSCCRERSRGILKCHDVVHAT